MRYFSLRNFEETLKKLWRTLRKLWGNFEESLRNFEGTLRKLWENIEGTLRKLWGNFEKTLRELWGSFEEILREFWGNFEEALRKLWGNFEGTRLFCCCASALARPIIICTLNGSHWPKPEGDSALYWIRTVQITGVFENMKSDQINLCIQSVVFFFSGKLVELSCRLQIDLWLLCVIFWLASKLVLPINLWHLAHYDACVA